ncbi:MAG: hypothetical protein BGO01_16265 [Armatimonadetes bacterium 55-13]|nr:ABC transporter permease [Armatimonadota bacterium]OJU65411.1 MAG: hypothetical protein BGO01_16265 [Armatimonadetes bacterium 55-13]
MRKILTRPEFVPAVLLILAFIAGTIQSPYFLDVRYLLDSTGPYAETGLLVIGLTFVIISGNIDLSVASNLAFVACATAKLAQIGLPMPAAATIGVLIGGLLGAFNGALVAYAKLPSFLVTLGTLALFRGMAQALMGSASVQVPSSFVGADRLDLPLLGVPLPFGIMIVFVVVLGLTLHRTIFGRWTFAVGTNEEAAFFASVPTPAVKFRIFVLAGLLAGLAGVLIDSRLGVARFDHARGLELEAITAVVLGGVSITGGRGSMIGSLLALLLIAVLKTQMILANITSEVQLTVTGTLLIVAVAITGVATRLSAPRKA